MKTGSESWSWRGESYWNLLRVLTVSTYKAREQSTVLGMAWSFLHPLLFLGVIYVFFSLQVGVDVDFYAAYVLVGVVHFAHFSTTTTAAMGALRSMRGISAHVVLPKEILVLGTIGANTVEFLSSLSVCVLFAWASGVPLQSSVSFLPVVVLAQFLVIIWIGLLLAICHVFVRDLEHIYQVFLRLLFFTTPIFYTAAFLGDGIAAQLLRLNPLTHVLEFSRSAIIDGTFRLSSPSVAAFVLVNAAACMFALFVFRRLEKHIAANV